MCVGVDVAEESFWLDRQRLANDDEVAMNSRVIGYQWNVTPMFYYQFNRGAQHTQWSGCAGIGFGIGNLDIVGNMIMTEQSGTPDVYVDAQAWSLSSGLFIEVQKGDWIMRLKSQGPGLDADD